MAARTLAFCRFGETAIHVVVNGLAGMVVWTPKGEPFAVGSFTVSNGKIASMEVLADPVRMRELEFTIHVD